RGDLSNGLTRSSALIDAPVPGKRTQVESLPVQRKAEPARSDGAGPAPTSAGGGQALPAPTRAKMESAFFTDFSAVRVHEDGAADAVGARAFTRCHDIHFGPGEYRPGDPAGDALLGHELAHVVQQAQGRVEATTQAKGLPVNDGRGLEHEAD